VEQVAYYLMKAYPNAHYVALNTALTAHNSQEWKDHWYFVGFVDEPVYQTLDGWPAWVANEDIHLSEEEWGLFFLHISSKDHVFRGIPIQKSPDDFASPRWFCWKMNDDGKTLTQLVADEIEIEYNEEEWNKNFRDVLNATFMDPLKKALDPGRDEE
jgi:hypothetical protein